MPALTRPLLKARRRGRPLAYEALYRAGNDVAKRELKSGKLPRKLWEDLLLDEVDGSVGYGTLVRTSRYTGFEPSKNETVVAVPPRGAETRHMDGT
jgi:hypothetical protein